MTLDLNKTEKNMQKTTGLTNHRFQGLFHTRSWTSKERLC